MPSSSNSDLSGDSVVEPGFRRVGQTTFLRRPSSKEQQNILITVGRGARTTMHTSPDHTPPPNYPPTRSLYPTGRVWGGCLLPELLVLPMERLDCVIVAALPPPVNRLGQDFAG